MKMNSKNKENILKTNNNINKNDFINKCKIDFVYKNRNKIDNKNKDKEIYLNDINEKMIDENIDYDINIKSSNINKTNKIKSIPLKLNNSCIFGIASK